MAEVLEILVNDIVNSILQDIIDTNNNDVEETYIVEEADDVEETYIVEEADDVEETYIVEEGDACSSSTIFNNDHNNTTNTTSNTIIVNIDRRASLMNGCVVQPKVLSLYILHGEGVISNTKIDDDDDALYLVNFDKASCDSYWKASDLMLIINGIVITECNINKHGYSGKWQENVDYNTIDTVFESINSSNTTISSPNNKDNIKSNSPSKSKLSNRLYEEAGRLKTKRLIAMQNNIQEFAKNATFSPKIPQVSQKLASQKEGLNYNNISDKLYSDTIYVKNFEKHEKYELEQKKLATFSPQLPSKTKELAQRNDSSDAVHDRLFSEASKKREKLLKMAEDKIQDEIKGLTFSPTISKLATFKSSPTDQDLDHGSRLYNYAALQHAKRTSLKEAVIKNEMKDVTFSPAIKYLQSSPTDTSVDVTTRLHEDDHRRRASLIQKRESIILDQKKEETFIPQISEFSRNNNVTAYRSMSPTSADAAAATARLYDDAIRKHDRSQFIQELNEEDYKSKNFTPKKFTAESNVKSRVRSIIDSKNSSPNSKNGSETPPKSPPKVIRRKSSPKSVNIDQFKVDNEPTEF